MSSKLLAYLAFDDLAARKGASVHIEQFARALAEAFGPLDVVTPGPASSTVDELWPGVSHHAFHVDGPSLIDRVLQFRRQAQCWWAGRRAAVAHVRSAFEGYPIARRKADFCERFVFEVNGLPSIELKYHYPAVADDTELLRKLRAQEQCCLAAADLIVTPSRVTAGYLARRGADPSRIRCIPNGVDCDLFTYRPPRPIGDEPLRLIYAGTMSPWQGVQVALEALARLLRERPARLTLAGPFRNRERASLETHCRGLGVRNAVDFTGPLSQAELVEAYHVSHIAVVPLMPDDRNLVQGCCPLKLLEAMACGVPVVASDLPVVREIVEHERQALLVHASSPRAICNAVQRLDGDRTLAMELSSAGRALVEGRFQWCQAGAALVASYREVLGLSSSRTPRRALLSAAG